jgi:EpsI family protein
MKTRILLLSLILLGAAAAIARASRPEIAPTRELLSGLPMQLGEWEGQKAADIETGIMAVLGVDDYVNRVYFNRKSIPASLYIGYYQSQREGDTMHSPLNCLPGAGWNPAKNGHIKVPIKGGLPIEINRITILKGMDKQLVLYWYQSHGRVIASEYWGKIYTVLDALRTNRTDAALVRVITPVAGLTPETEAAAEQSAVNFVESLYPMLSRFLPE